MGWLPFTSKKDSPKLESTQVQQQSHSPVNIAPNSDISHTLSQISTEVNLTVKEPKINTTEEFNSSVQEFVEKRPRNMFVIDGEKDKEESIICTSNETGGKTCLKLKYNNIQLFKQMQKLEYFCSLPDDINATYFECRKIQ